MVCVRSCKVREWRRRGVACAVQAAPAGNRGARNAALSHGRVMQVARVIGGTPHREEMRPNLVERFEGRKHSEERHAHALHVNEGDLLVNGFAAFDR